MMLEQWLDKVTCADAREAAKELPINSIDLIFTDPPYAREYLELYGWLAEIGARILRPGGWLLTMGGGLYADEILAIMSNHLTYHYTLLVALAQNVHPTLRPHGQRAPVIAGVKPLYAFAKGKSEPRTVVYSPFSGSGNDKRFHHWGQDERSARYFIDCFSEIGDVVLDPFVGGGTTAIVCKYLERRVIAFDIDEAAVETTRNRLRNPLYMPRRNGQMVLEFAE